MKKHFLALCVVLVGLGSSAVCLAQTTTKLPIDLFFKPAKIRNVALSPSGNYLAITTQNKSKQLELGIIDLAKPGKVNIIGKNDDMSVLDPVWITDDRLYFTIYSQRDLADVRNGNQYAINRDGSRQMEIKETIYGTLDDGTNDILIGKYSFTNADQSVSSVRLYRMDTLTMRLTDHLKDLQPKDVIGWLLDKENEPRFAFASSDDYTVVHYRAPGQKDWVEVTRFKYADPNAYSPAFIDGATGQVYVTMNNRDGFSSLYRYDVSKRQVESEPFFEVKGYDVEAVAVRERKTKRLMGFYYETDAQSTVWLDEEMKAIQATIDQNMPATINRLNCRGESPKLVCVVRSFSDQQPDKYFLYRPDSQELALIGDTRPDINPEQMAKVELHRFKARDGLEIPVYVTTPAAKATGPRPTLVMIHGGPSARTGTWSWNRYNQFLASRGYVVIEPDFRGSTGYGDKFWRAGWEKWGLEMQDDITDAANWAVSKGIADKNRMAIIGASYGGYATLMGLIKTPELFRCGINFVGVTDIDLLFSVTWSDQSEKSKRFGITKLVGDREKNQERFKATSPLYQQERLTKPLLMGYGAADKRVPLVHGTKFRDAVMKHNKDVEWVAYDREQHSWVLESTHLDWWARVENFLEKYMKPE